MEENRQGVYVKSKSSFVEIEAHRSDTYRSFVDKAARKLKMGYRSGNMLSLFKMNGARVLNEEINLNGKDKPWTLGNYLLKMKKSPTSVKLGIGYVFIFSDESNSNSTNTVGLKLCHCLPSLARFHQIGGPLIYLLNPSIIILMLN